MFPKQSLFLAGLILCNGYVNALPWLGTEYVEIEVSTAISATTYTFASSTDIQLELVYTDVVTVIPTAASFRTLDVTTTFVTIFDLTKVVVQVPTGVGTTVARRPTSYTTYYVNITYTAPETCSSRWEYVTSVDVRAPSIVVFDPITVVTVDTNTAHLTPTKFAAFVNPTDIAPDKLSTLSNDNRPWFRASCTLPVPGTATTSGRYNTYPTGTSSGYGGEYAFCDSFIWTFLGAEIGSGYICDGKTVYTHGLSITTFVIVWIATWFGVFFICGCIESYVMFAALSQGRKAHRGTPCLFACLAPMLSCFCLCFRKPGYEAKSQQEQLIMRQQWKETSILQRIRLWLKWGFRYKYPIYLGDAPSRRKNWGDKNAVLVQQQDGEVREMVPMGVGHRVAERQMEALPAYEATPQIQIVKTRVAIAA